LTKYTVAVEDKQYKIDVTKTENPEHFTVKIDDKPYKLELKNKFEYNTPIQIKLGEKTFTIQITKNEKQTPFQIRVKDIAIRAEVKTQQINSFSPSTATVPQTLTAIKTPRGKAATEGAVTAPMAGKIVSMRAKKGETVKAGMVVCILEAMKMENEIVTPRGGIVQEINVSEGSTVSEGDVLIVIK
jgi:biotin carboxyl carrier protein